MLKDSIAHNILLPNEDDLKAAAGFVSPAKERALVGKAIDTFEVKCASPYAPVNSLSGGNKQKVNLSRWLVKDLSVIILDCPTRGVDVGVKAYIYHVLESARKEGKGILMISDELPEAMGMSDRLLILNNGRVGGILDREGGFTQEAIVEVMM